ncbi:MAG: AI-2E family transporter, partial [Bdellovibrionota bacterium]
MAKTDSEIAAPQDLGVAIKIPFSTVAIVLATILFVRVMGYLLPLLMPLLLGGILAVSLAPIVSWLESKKVPRGISLTCLTLLLTLTLAGGVTLVLPQVMQEGGEFMAHLPQLKQELLRLFPEGGAFHNLLSQALSRQNISLHSIDSGSLLSAGHMALGGIGEFLLILIFAIY